ncbi:hypothetical protein EXS74_01095 [Candidatus Woesearchaeota archaeon]|nr:hypothetical protein [Candidatus Woesearchaeota archaeon]
MKRKGVIILLTILLLPAVLGLSVSLSSPSSGNTTNMTSIIFSCATSDTFTISSIDLYMNTSSSSWIKVTGQSNSSTNANFLVSSLTQGTYIWNCFAVNSNGENVSASSNSSLTISTLAFSGIIANQSSAEDSNSSTLFDLDTYFTGASYYTFSGNSSSIFIIDSNNGISISPSGNFTGSQNVTITGKYGSSSVSSNEILINITNVNDAPLLTDQFTSSTLDTNANTTINMNSYFTDIDLNTNLTYSITAEHISITQNESNILIIPETDWEGTENITITASDGTASVTSNSFEITVGSASSSSNNAPTIDSYTPESDPTLDVDESQDFTITSSDGDEETLTTTWYLDDVDQSITANTLSYSSSTEGVFTIKVVVSDGTDEVSHSWTVIVGETVVNVDSILSEQSSNAVCGNNIIEDEETCSSCALDVICEEGSICTNGICKEKKSATKAILILVIGSIIILIIAIVIYYITTLKKTGKKMENTPFQYAPAGASPPSDYTDFYRDKK